MTVGAVAIQGGDRTHIKRMIIYSIEIKIYH